jgi:16S rRNA (guanine966-N2)-methyltransferase
MRIVAGRFRGRSLAAPGDDRTRPTSDRVRESVFTGAMGLEALSRGTAFCLFVEEDAAARGAIRRNIEALGIGGITKVFRRDATALGPAGHRGGFGLVFLDPPYEQGLAQRALASAAAGGWLARGAVAVIEESRRATVTMPPGFASLDQRTWGDTQIVFARFRGPP